MVVIDSGLGGLSVVRAMRQLSPQHPALYVADTAAFPYGNRSAETIIARGIALIAALQEKHSVAQVVVACNTLSTLALAALRSAFPTIRFVGTVPAIKVAASGSQTRRFTLLATPNTAHSRYTRELIAQFASDCVVDCYGAPNLARMAEAHLRGERVDAAVWQAEIAPCFHDDAKGRTDQVILGCTHYPLVADMLAHHAPWPVTWVDSSMAIARQALKQPVAEEGTTPLAYVTDAQDVARYTGLFMQEGFAQTATLSVAAATPHAAHG
jgi:glutamate racemase